MLPIIQIGPLAVQTPGLVILLSLWLGLSFAEKYVGKFGLEVDKLYNLTVLSLLAGAIGGRLAYVARFPSAFLENPVNLISTNPGLFDIFAAAAVGSIAALAYILRKKLRLLFVLDALTPVLLILLIGTNLANLASGNAFGSPTNLPWSIELWGASRHPSQLYGLVYSIIVLGTLLPGRQKSHLAGRYFFKFLAFVSGGRLFLEAFRGDSVLVFESFRSAQITSWVLLVISLIVLIWLDIRDKKNYEQILAERIQ